MKQILDRYIETTFGERTQAVPKFAQFAYNYRRFFPDAREARILDIGIGRGEMLSCMKSWGYTDYHGIDISPETVAFCKELGLRCEVVEDTVVWLDNHQGVFDVITLLDVLEHIKKDETVMFLTALKRALKPGGVLIIQTPNLQAPDGQLHRYNDFTHEFGYTEPSLKQVLVAAGFSIFTFHGFEILVKRHPLMLAARIVRFVYWKLVTLLRMLNTNLYPNILHPVFFAAVRRERD